MANNVFANGLEIACKAGDGKSVACFPDPCFSPPDPSKVILPYANTAYAKDTANGSKTVFISGKPVMKKDHSHFKTSTGNEPAAGLKGVVTGVKKGKAYFASWSMNVMVEGQNVDRHTDMMTHNHGSAPGNTGVNFYIDTMNAADCAENQRDKERKCEISKDDNDEFIKDAKARNKKRKKLGKPTLAVRNKTWKDKHCGPVMLLFDQPDGVIKKMETLRKEVDDLKDDLIKAAKEKGVDIVQDKLTNKALAVVGCGVIGGVVGFFFGGGGGSSTWCCSRC